MLRTRVGRVPAKLVSRAQAGSVRSVASTTPVNQEVSSAPSVPATPPPIAPAAAASSKSAASSGASSPFYYSREELANLTLQNAQESWPLKQQALQRHHKEYQNVLALSQSVVPNTATALEAERGVPSTFLQNPTVSINSGQVGYWRPMARLLLLKDNISAADLANPAPYSAVSYEEAETILLDEAAAVSEAQKAEDDELAAATYRLENNLSLLAAKESAEIMSQFVEENVLLKGAEGGRGGGRAGRKLLQGIINAGASGDLAKANGEALGQEGGSASVGGGSKLLGKADGASPADFPSPLMKRLEEAAAAESQKAASTTAAVTAGSGSSVGAFEEAVVDHLSVDLSPPVTGALTFMRLRGNPAPSSAASAADEAIIDGALAAGAGHPSPNQLHPLATLWLDASIKYLESTKQRLQGYIATAKAMVQDKRPGSSETTLAAVGLDLATTEEVIRRLSSVPMQPLSNEQRAWLKTLSVDQVDSLLSALSLRRRGVTVAGKLTTTPAEVDSSSPLALRLQKIEGAIKALKAAKMGEPLSNKGAATPHLVRYPTVRQLHHQLHQAATATAVPGFSDVTSAAAARLAQYGGVVALEATKLQAALDHANNVIRTFGNHAAAGNAAAEGKHASVSVTNLHVNNGDASITIGDKLEIQRQLLNPATAVPAPDKASDVKPESKAAATIVARQLNDGHLPTLLQPLSFILTPAEWTGLVTTALVSAPAKGGYIAHPPKIGTVAVDPSVASADGSATPGAYSENAVAADDATLEQTAAGAAATRGLKALMQMEKAAGEKLDQAMKELEEKLAKGNKGEEGRALMDKLRKQVGFAKQAVEAGAFDGRTASLAQVLESLIETARNAAAASGGLKEQAKGLSSAYVDDVPALIKWYWSKANASTPEAMLEGRTASFKNLNQTLAEVAAVAELSHMCNDAAANAFAASGHVYSFGASSDGSEEQLRLSSLTQVIPLPLEAASGVPLPSLVDHNGRVLAKMGTAASQAIADTSATNPLSALWPTPSMDEHQYYPPSKRVTQVPRGDGLPAEVPSVKSLPPELTVTSVYGETGCSSVPAASRVIDDFIAQKALEEARRTGKPVDPNIAVSSLLRRSTAARTSEVAIITSEVMLGRVVDAAVKTLTAAPAPSGAGGSKADAAAAEADYNIEETAKAVVREVIDASPLGIGAPSDVIPSTNGTGGGLGFGSVDSTTPAEATSIVNVDSSAVSDENGVSAGTTKDGKVVDGENVVYAYGKTAELALGAMDGTKDITDPEAMGGLPVIPSANPARTRAAKMEALVSAVLRTAKVKAEAYNAAHGLLRPHEATDIGIAGPTGPDGKPFGTGPEGMARHVTPELVRQVEIALATNTGVPVVKEDGSVVLVDPRTGGLYSGGVALQWRNYEYEPSEHYRGRGGRGGHADSAPSKGRHGLSLGVTIEGGEAAAQAAAMASKGAAGAQEEEMAWARFNPYSTVHKRIAEAIEARDLGAVWTLFTEHKRMKPQEGDPDFLLYEMVMDACAQAKRADLLFEVLWPEVCRLRMVVTDTMTFLLFKGACLSVEPRGSPNFVHLARAEAIFKHHANTTSTASGVKQYAGNGGSDMPLEHQGGITRSWYVALISACLEANETAKAFEYFNALKRAGYEADPAMYSHMAAKLVASGSAEQLHHLWRTLVRSPNFSVPKWLYTQLIVSFARLGMIQDMEECRERMGRRLDRFQRHPEPLARSAMLEAYLAAGMVENARDVLAELTAGTTGNGVNDVVHLSVGLQSKLAHSVQAKLREAQVALEKSAKPVEGVEGASSVVKLVTRGGRTGATGGGYIAKGVADSCIEGLVAAYSRPQVIPPFAHTPAASLVPSIDKVKPSNILPGLLSIPAPGVKHDTLQALQDLPQRAERLSVSKIFESGAELVARCTGLVERAMALQEQLTQNYEAEEDIREAASYLGALHSRAVPPKSDGRSQGEIFDPSNPDGAPDNDFDEELSDLDGGGGADEDDRNVDMSEATKPPHTQSVAFHGKFEGENVRAAAFTSVLRGRAEWQAFLEKEGIAILSQAELEEAEKEEKKKDDSSNKSKSGRR